MDIAAVERYLAALATAAPAWSPAAAPGGLAVVGEAVRGDNRHGAAVHPVGLVRHETGAVLGQVAVAAKSNEITAFPRLLADRDLTGMVTTVDALLTQRALALLSAAPLRR